MSANDPAATDTAAIIQGLRDELQNFENIRLQNERQNEENLNSVSIILPTEPFTLGQESTNQNRLVQDQNRLGI